MAVFHFPGEPSQAYVKRVVGLPGESVQIVDGNVHRSMARSHGKASTSSARCRSWCMTAAMFLMIPTASHGGFSAEANQDSGWPAAGARSAGTFVHEPVEHAHHEPDDLLDWLVYRHWDPVLNRYGPIRDHYAYNGGDLGAENVVPDLSLEARLTIGREVEMIAVMIRSGGDRFVVRIPVKGEDSVEVARNDHKQLVVPWATPLADDRPLAVHGHAPGIGRRPPTDRDTRRAAPFSTPRL